MYMDKIKIEINNKKYEIVNDEYLETWGLDNENVVVIDKQQIACNTINSLAENNVVDDSALDEAIWSIIDDIGGEIKNIAYNYANNNNIKIQNYYF